MSWNVWPKSSVTVLTLGVLHVFYYSLIVTLWADNKLPFLLRIS
jgi:hypothetical protein